MNPYRGSSRSKWLHSLGEETEHHSGKNITAPRRRQICGRVRVDRSTTVGGGNDRVGTLEQDYRAALLRCATRPLWFAAARVK